MKIHTIVALITVSLSSLSLANNAPYGLSWDQSLDDIRSQGIELSKVDSNDGDQFTTTSLPDNLSGIKGYSLFFSEGVLVKVVATTPLIEQDPTGTKGKEIYRGFKRQMQEQFDAVGEAEKMWKPGWHDAHGFYHCLSQKGECGHMLSTYKDAETGGWSMVQLKGTRFGKGYVELTSENPESTK